MFSPRFKKSINNKGFSIIEALVGITLAALLLVAFTSLITQTIKINQANMSKLKAMMYLQELIEVAKDLEQSATTTIFGPPNDCNTSNACHPEADNSVSPPEWNLVLDEQKLENDTFTRSITISATVDANVKMATATISWHDGFKYNTSTLETYLYYYGQ